MSYLWIMGCLGFFKRNEQAALNERALIVKYLRAQKDRLGQPSGKALRLADKIEQGEHLQEENPWR